jgi:hypothetical protein
VAIKEQRLPLVGLEPWGAHGMTLARPAGAPVPRQQTETLAEGPGAALLASKVTVTPGSSVLSVLSGWTIDLDRLVDYLAGASWG